MEAKSENKTAKLRAKRQRKKVPLQQALLCSGTDMLCWSGMATWCCSGTETGDACECCDANPQDVCIRKLIASSGRGTEEPDICTSCRKSNKQQNERKLVTAMMPKMTPISLSLSLLPRLQIFHTSLLTRSRLSLSSTQSSKAERPAFPIAQIRNRNQDSQIFEIIQRRFKFLRTLILIQFCL